MPYVIVCCLTTLLLGLLSLSKIVCMPAQPVLSQIASCSLHALMGSALRRAVLVQYSELAGDSTQCLDDQFMMLKDLDSVCSLHPAVMDCPDSFWRDKGAIYRQHAVFKLKQLGKKVPTNCSLCQRPLHTEKPSEPNNPLLMKECGHIHHMVCHMPWTAKSDKRCPSCP